MNSATLKASGQHPFYKRQLLDFPVPAMTFMTSYLTEGLAAHATQM
jgi:hypothetical protein